MVLDSVSIQVISQRYSWEKILNVLILTTTLPHKLSRKITKFFSYYEEKTWINFQLKIRKDI